MARLPIPGGDQGTWGAVLNEYLSVGHSTDGKHKNGVFNVKEFGAKGDGVTDDKAAILAAFQAAEAVGQYSGGIVFLPPGIYAVSGGLSLSGFSASLQGSGVQAYGLLLKGCVIKAINQTGPVLDLTGWRVPSSFLGRMKFSGFALQGDGTSDVSKVKSGLKIPVLGSVVFEDIVIGQTGGPCMDIGTVYLCDFNRITLINPVDAKLNDVPYIISLGSNGNRFTGIGLRSMKSSGDVGVSGAAIFKDNGTYPSHSNLFLAWWIEFLHPPTNGTLFYLAGSANTVSDFQFFDISKETDATNTSVYTLADSAVGNMGGNTIRGNIPGRGTGVGSLDTGILVKQSRNFIQGIKGYNGYNVTLSPGVIRTTVILAGSESGLYPSPAFIDNSGNTNNVLIDYVDRQAPNPDTTGATIAQLETEVNELKAALRNAGILRTV